VTDNDNYSSLLPYGINYDRQKIYVTYPCGLYYKNITTVNIVSRVASG